MRLMVVMFVFIMFILAACNTASENKTSKPSKNNLTVAFTVNEKDLIPEGITYDSQSKQFFLSSIYKQKIITVDKEGNHFDFIKTGQDSMAESLGLKVDVDKRRLWVLSNEKDMKCSFVHIYNLDTKELLRRLPVPANDPHLLNDLALTAEGSAYITDTHGSRLYFVSAGLTELKLFMANDSLLNEVNGIAISSDNQMLYVASNNNGISIVDIKTKSISPIENWLSVDTRGIDGLMLYENNLFGIRNGIAGLLGFHIARYKLDQSGREIIASSLVDHKSELIEVPTTGVIVNNSLYCLAVTSLGVLLANRMDETGLLNEPTVLKYDIVHK